MKDDERTRVSRTLSYALRHAPQDFELRLDAAGFTDVEVLLASFARHGHALTHDQLREIVDTSDKKRFAFSEDGRRIRAVQGHSVDVALGYAPASPPRVLFHGTVARYADAIARDGLLRGERHHVHLADDEETARAVGARRGDPIILLIDAAAMVRDGFTFFRADNGVWLTEHVPPRYLRAHSSPA